MAVGVSGAFCVSAADAGGGVAKVGGVSCSGLRE